MIRPMPSPRGTNYEKLYILQGRRSPSMAYDSAVGAYPDARTYFEGGVSTLSKWAGENLSDKDIEELIERLKCAIAERTMNTVKDTVSAPAMDAKEIARWRDYGANFARKFAADRAKASASATAERDYYERFPNARRLESSANSTVATTPRAKLPLALTLPQSAHTSSAFRTLAGWRDRGLCNVETEPDPKSRRDPHP